ncbi:choline-phosphate cytidylyltransferase [Tessaracoccus bendigoensis DSM 12906]|uniref:Choline-phosphate cytidylyltransferase n=1 Tax=Tessaracoccus bendigoensis DSM 12906 TaxID=1123357 RepID=A0A1M6DJL0_9ACTN|nr:choline-phosphate cytidylyltransferase [Tessaracoccus bendigoensis DSM 12906]
MKRVITYGTFDLFHDGHKRLLERARALGDYLIVGVTSPSYDNARGKLNVRQSLVERIGNVVESGLADEVIVEEYEGQKVLDIQRLGVDVFVIGSDWAGKFDHLADYCEVVYLERTKGVSSTGLREAGGVLRMGIIGTGRIARRFVREARYVSGVNVEEVWARTHSNALAFVEEFELAGAPETLPDLLQGIDAVYIATPHETHVGFARLALEAGVHVLCEKPMALSVAELEQLSTLADERSLVLLEALKTAFAPGFQRMVAVARSGTIGSIRSVSATFTKLVRSGREVEGPEAGALSELASYPFLAIVKLLGTSPESVTARALKTDGHTVDLFARVNVDYPHAIATATVGLGVKSEGSLVVSGTEGYLYVPAPWWLTDYFETRFEDPRQNRKYYTPFDGDGLRYELAEFSSMIRDGASESFMLRRSDSLAIAALMERSRRDARPFGGTQP